MFKQKLLQLHRWLTLIFALPLAVVILTGLIFSMEPMLIKSSAQKGDVTVEKIIMALNEFDVTNKVTGLVYAPYSKTLTLQGVGEEGETDVDMRTGEEAESESSLENFLRTVKLLHEKLVYNLGWLVGVSSLVMLILMVLGILMGLPRLRNSLAGWHKGVAWFGLPLLVISPLTGTFLAYGITFTTPPSREVLKPISVKETVELVSKSHDLTTLLWVRSRGGRMLARVNEDGEYRVYMASHEHGLVPAQRNWPRLLHEGNWSGYFSAGINFLVGLAISLLFITGLWMWARRTFRKKPIRN